MSDPLMSADEIRRVAGGYVQPSKQLAELKRQGFWRARRARLTGEVILERAHYEAVCSGQDARPSLARPEHTPTLRPA